MSTYILLFQGDNSMETKPTRNGLTQNIHRYNLNKMLADIFLTWSIHNSHSLTHSLLFYFYYSSLTYLDG